MSNQRNLVGFNKYDTIEVIILQIISKCKALEVYKYYEIQCNNLSTTINQFVNSWSYNFKGY